MIGDIRIWEDGDGVNPGIILREVMREYGAEGRKIGIEYHAYGLTGQRSRMIDEALSGFCVTMDASDLVRKIRLVKSESELAYIRKAGEISDLAWRAANQKTVPGAFLDKMGMTMSLGETSIVTSTGPERVNHAPMELVVN